MHKRVLFFVPLEAVFFKFEFVVFVRFPEMRQKISYRRTLYKRIQFGRNNDAGNGYNTHFWQTIVVRGWMEELGVKQNLVSKDGIQVYRW